MNFGIISYMLAIIVTVTLSITNIYLVGSLLLLIIYL